MQQVYKSLPDDKPITAICIVEEIGKCPSGFYPVSKTHDQDSDADLWKEVTFFGRRISRYLCISKTVGISNYIVENVGVIGEKDIPPDGYSLIPRSIDGDSKAWRKRQVCYSLTRRTHATTAVTDIILLSKYKKALPGFSLAGDINGLTLCYKTSNHIPPLNGPVSLGYPLSPPTNGSEENSISRSEISNGVYPNLGKPTVESPSDEYVNLIRPIRPAPQVPAQPPNNYVPSTYGTLSNYQGLEGIPFILNPKFKSSSDIMMQLPAIKVKTEAQLDNEYSYDFRLERQT